MWLRDSLPFDLSGVQIMIYGCDTQLQGSQAFQDLEALASTLRSDLEAMRGANSVSQADLTL